MLPIRRKRAGLGSRPFSFACVPSPCIELSFKGIEDRPALVPVSPQFPALSVCSAAEYNPHMRTIPAADVDAWLRACGVVVAASDRAARAVRAAYHRARRAEGLSAWAAPEVLDWNTFAHQEWERRVTDMRLVLNATQEQSLWAGIVAESEQTAGWLDGPRRRLATLAVEAQDLMCAFAPDRLRAAQRRTWQQDAATFSEWLSSFDQLCNVGGLVSPGRLPLELLALLEKDN